MRILIVEDEPRLLRSLAQALREAGYAVDTADAGDDGLFKAQSYNYDAIVLDVMLPRLDGWEMLDRLRPLARRSDLQIHCDLIPTEACCNADRLSQVITNLFTNAIHYNKPNGTIRIRTHTENGAAVLTITDTGQGIAPDHLPHVFERFYRSDKSRSRAHGHFGLGLAICKAIIDTEGGRIEVASQLGAGTTFTVRLPTARPSQHV